MKFDQLIEYNTRDILVKKSFTIYAGEIISRPLSKKTEIEHISGSIV